MTRNVLYVPNGTWILLEGCASVTMAAANSIRKKQAIPHNVWSEHRTLVAAIIAMYVGLVCETSSSSSDV